MGSDTEISGIIFFDGVCNLCNSSVNFIIDRDPKGRFRFASLQSDVAKSLLPPQDVQEDNLESIVFKANGRIYRRSRAALEIARRMRRFWPLLYVFVVVPGFLRDIFYDLIARNRYKWFGKRDECRIPTPDLRARFIGS